VQHAGKELAAQAGSNDGDGHGFPLDFLLDGIEARISS
jgi:hypothetical protein